MNEPSGATEVVLEVGTTRVFAAAVEWPGWCRSGRTEEAALAALATALPRYQVVAQEAHHPVPSRAADRLLVVERVPGSATTDFGAPGEVAAVDHRDVTAADAERLGDLVAAAWRVLDRIVPAAPEQLRKGPRGGGRDRTAIVEHVLAAEVAYARKLGLRLRQPAPGDVNAVAAEREAILGVLRSARADPAGLAWPPRYAARRIAWHVLDHAWEIEDRSDVDQAR